MPPIPQLEIVLWYLSLILKAAVLWRLISLHLVQRYPALCVCMGFQFLRTIALLTLNINSNTYALSYFATLPLLLATYVWVALEIYAKAFEDYRGLSWAGKRVMLGVLGLSAVSAIFAHHSELYDAGERFQVIRVVLVVESAVCLMLLFFLVAVAAFLVWYPATIRKNLLLYSFTFSVYTGAHCATIFLRNSDPSTLTHIASMAQLGMDDLSLLVIAVFLRTTWETARPKLVNLSNEHGQKLLGQLGRLNAALENKQLPPHVSEYPRG